MPSVARSARPRPTRAQGSLAAMSSPSVPLSDLLTVAVQGAHGGLLRLSQQVAIPMSDQQRRKAILDYVAHAQGLLLRLLVLVRWSIVQHVEGQKAPRAAGLKALTLLELQLSEMRRAADSVLDVRRLPASSERRRYEPGAASLSMLCHRRRAAEAPLS